MKILKYILLVIVLLGCQQVALSQYYLKAKSDSISLKSDSILLHIAGYRGTINWQASTDLINWVPLNEIKDTLGIRIDSTAYYRATIVEGTCKPVMSDTVFLIEKLTITGSNQFTVDSLGGVFLLPSGIKVKIPRGAVIEPKEVRLDILSSDSANNLAVINNAANIFFLTGISISTDVFDFTKPIKIKIPVQNIDVTGLPLLYQLDTVTNSWRLTNETFIVSPRDKFIEIILKGSDQKGIISKGLSQDDLSFMRLIFLKYTGIWLDEDPCRWFGFTSKTEDYDFQSSGGCAVSKIENKIVYHDCRSQEESYSAIGIAPACKPELTGLPGDCIKIKKGETVKIELSTSIGGLPLPGQTINVNTSSNLSAPKVLTTLSDGSITLNVTGNEIGDGSISLSVPFDYYLSTIKASGGGINEYNPYNQVVSDPPLNYQVCVTVIDVPKVSTASATDINCTSATVGGNVISDNNSEVTERGVLFQSGKVSAGSGSGTFYKILTGLESNTIYSVKAYAVNEVGMGYGDLISFTTPDCDTIADCDHKMYITDIEGNTYRIVNIGTQVWMAENLKTTRFNDSSAIPLISDPLAWDNLRTPGYCWMNNDEATYKTTYGALYNWYVVDSTSNGGKNVCPAGWHVPIDSELTPFFDYLAIDYYGKEGLALKTTSHWLEAMPGENGNGYDIYCFSALPAGFRAHGGRYNPYGPLSVGYVTVWWTTTESSYWYSRRFSLASGSWGIGRSTYDKREGNSVRCIKDSTQ